MEKNCTYQSPYDDGRKCIEPALSDGQLCIFHSHGLSKDCDFLKNRLLDRISHYDRQGALNFDGAYFPEGLDLEGKTFPDSTYFRDASFFGEITSFKNVNFPPPSRQLFFDGAIFYSKETLFTGAKFRSKETSFKKTTFRGEIIDFTDAHFSNLTEFRGFEPSAVFYWEEVFFGGIHFDEIGDKSPKYQIIFEWVNLSRVSFEFTDLSRIQFLHVDWAKPPNWNRGPLHWGSWRNGLYDEIIWRKKKYLSPNFLSWSATNEMRLVQLDRHYRYLKSYYRDTGQNELSDHFHYGFMEVQWHKWKGKRKPGRVWEWFLRWMNGYGEDANWAFTLLFLIFLLFGLGYRCFDVPSWDSKTSRSENVIHSILYSFEVGTLGRINLYKKDSESHPTDSPEPTAHESINYISKNGDLNEISAQDTSQKALPRIWVVILHILETIFVPAQTAMFILALRNRFRR